MIPARSAVAIMRDGAAEAQGPLSPLQPSGTGWAKRREQHERHAKNRADRRIQPPRQSALASRHLCPAIGMLAECVCGSGSPAARTRAPSGRPPRSGRWRDSPFEPTPPIAPAAHDGGAYGPLQIERARQRRARFPNPAHIQSRYNPGGAPERVKPLTGAANHIHAPVHLQLHKRARPTVRGRSREQPVSCFEQP